MSVKTCIVIGLLLSACIATRSAFAEDAVEIARSQLTVSSSIGPYYVEGGNGPLLGTDNPVGADIGFDCSGLTWYAFGHIGVEIDTQAKTQSEMEDRGELFIAPALPDLTELQSGDLLFFDTRDVALNIVNHVGIYDTDGYFIQAAYERVGIVRSHLTTDWISQKNGVHWEDRLLRVLRLPSHKGTPSSAFSIGEGVSVTDNGTPVIDLRREWDEVGTRTMADSGTVVFGPVKDTVTDKDTGESMSHWWWMVDFDEGVDGWVSETSLTSLGPLLTMRTDEATATSGLPQEIDVLANDEPDTLTITSTTPGAHGSVDISNNGERDTVTYTSQAGYVGPDTFTYSVVSPEGGIGEATVTVTVTTGTVVFSNAACGTSSGTLLQQTLGDRLGTFHVTATSAMRFDEVRAWVYASDISNAHTTLRIYRVVSASQPLPDAELISKSLPVPVSDTSSEESFPLDSYVNMSVGEQYIFAFTVDDHTWAFPDALVGEVHITSSGCDFWGYFIEYDDHAGAVPNDLLTSSQLTVTFVDSGATAPQCDVGNPVLPCELNGTTYDTFAGNYTQNRSFYKASSYDVSYVEDLLCLSLKDGLPHTEGYAYLPNRFPTVWTSPPPYNVDFGIFGQFNGSCIRQDESFSWIGVGSGSVPPTILEDFESYPLGPFASGATNGIVSWEVLSDDIVNRSSEITTNAFMGSNALLGILTRNVATILSPTRPDTTRFSYWIKVDTFNLNESEWGPLTWDNITILSDNFGGEQYYTQVCHRVGDDFGVAFGDIRGTNFCYDQYITGHFVLGEWVQIVVEVDFVNHSARGKVNNSVWSAPYQLNSYMNHISHFRLFPVWSHETRIAYDQVEIVAP